MMVNEFAGDGLPGRRCHSRTRRCLHPPSKLPDDRHSPSLTLIFPETATYSLTPAILVHLLLHHQHLRQRHLQRHHQHHHQLRPQHHHRHLHHPSHHNVGSDLQRSIGEESTGQV